MTEKIEGGARGQTEELFDLEAVYDSEIAPLMTQIIAICKKHSMPMFASFAFANTEEEGWNYCTTYLHTDGRRPRSFAVASREVCGGHGARHWYECKGCPLCQSLRERIKAEDQRAVALVNAFVEVVAKRPKG